MASLENLLLNSPSTNLSGWVSGGQFFMFKPEALLYATKHNTDISYYYNDHVFASVDWSIEPTETLEELYRERAQQLRDQYDYIVLMFSGGSDSTNMVKTYLNNNIFIDEVVSFGAWNECVSLNDNCNIEVTHAGKPVIDEILKTSTRFTHLNLFDHFDQAYTSTDWILTSDTYMAPYVDFAQKGLYSIPHIRQLVDQGKKVCYVWAIDKPRIIVNQNYYYLVFTDQHFSSYQYGTTWNNGFSQEWFYSDVSCSRLITKMLYEILHCVESSFPRDQIATALMARTPETRELINCALYRNTWDPTTFTLGKNATSLHPKKWHTFETQMNQSRQYKNWSNAIDDFVKYVNPKFLAPSEHHCTKSFFKIYPIQPFNPLKSMT